MQKFSHLLSITIIVSCIAFAINGCGDRKLPKLVDLVADTEPEDTPMEPEMVVDTEPEDTPMEPEMVVDTEPEDTPMEPEMVVDTEPETTIIGTVVYIDPAKIISPAVGQQLQVSINVRNAEDVIAYEFTIGFDPIALRYVELAGGDYLPPGAFAPQPQTTANSIYYVATSLGDVTETADGTLATLTFEVLDVKASTITLNNVLLSDSNATAITLSTVNSKVVVQ